VSAYKHDPRVEIGVFEAYVSSPDGPRYIYAAAGTDDWVVTPSFTSTELRAAEARGDMETVRSIAAQNPHYPTFDDAVWSLIGDPR